MGKFPQSSTLWNGRRWWKNLGLIPSACERLGKHSLILQELSVWTFLLRASPPTQLNLWQLTSSMCFFLPSYPIPFPRGSRPCSSWLLNARPILPPTTPGSSLGPTLSTLLECSFLFSSSFGSTATRLTKQHSAHSAGFPGALQSGLNSYPCPIQPAPALSKNLNGKWWLSANPYLSKSRVKEKTRQNYSTTAEIRLGLGYDAALTWARHCARCGCEHCLL